MSDTTSTQEDVLGTLVLQFNGTVVQSTGDLKNDPNTSKLIIGLLQDVNSLIESSGKMDVFKRLSMDCVYAVTIFDNQIHVVRKRLSGE
ncbi:hypothetical protein PROFUN_01328 [Planoprotostelium fungivorum]|uniref:Late endosomal/lysosomal adaptor and MAPK and MTOR activator 4 n=1 Tax=Planoprotostelium fungivorum TaxID=1890364 RepID=A0A2P6NZR4_9EUKA|nr:hypothetical protein PROFUN_01328 [Planoprotostelium fungivorum]